MGTPVCSAQHCSQVSQYVNDTCKQEGWPVSKPVLVCDASGKCCECKCSCLAFDTPVAVSATQTKSIQTLKLQDPVLAFDPTGASQQRSVAFSDGTTATSVQPEMAYVTVKIGTDEHTVTVTLNHTFLHADTRKLIQAQMLSVGTGLLLADGTTTAVTKLEIKSYTGGVWNIATSIGKPDNLDGHLIDTDGILSGDFAVQIFYDDLVKQGLATAPGVYPAVTTRGHDQAADAQASVTLAARPRHDFAQFLSTVTGAHQVIRQPNAQGGAVTLHGDHSATLEIPAAARTGGYLTEIQADELRIGGLDPVTRNPQRAGDCLWLMKLFNAFFPDIHFVYDASAREANGYAFYLGATKYILVQGGLVRAAPLEWQGLSLILGYLVSRFRDQPQQPNGLLCKPEADYYAPAPLQTIFNHLYPDVIFDAISQVEATFKLIPTKADQPATGCHASNLGCRITTYRQAIGFHPLPVCAGGPPAADLRLLSASSTDADVTLTFSAPLNDASAIARDNYFFDPHMDQIHTITNGNASNTVVISGGFAPKTAYTITASNVKSTEGNTLDPNYVTSGFHTP
ncbi:Ig-like domain-containing protein [Burkholderia pyrrocinia]|uniref:Ig-like domain-containing protein n=1 Tax=Burkholderia pyrrocinia TaxID=60550 RepID=UPI00158E4DB5|nr:Ig-like domain-containing protein [Burkholderia pyrrocinia]